MAGVTGGLDILRLIAQAASPRVGRVAPHPMQEVGEVFRTRRPVANLEDYDLQRRFFRGQSGRAFDKGTNRGRKVLWDFYMEDPDGYAAMTGRTGPPTETLHPYSLSRQRGDARGVKPNTRGGLWVTDSPRVASTYPASPDAIVTPIYTKRPDAAFDADFADWDDFWRSSKEYREAHGDPGVKVLQIDNISDIGPKWDLYFPELLEEGRYDKMGLKEAKKMQAKDSASTLRFLRKHPEDDLPAISTIDFSAFPYRQGGLAQCACNRR